MTGPVDTDTPLPALRTFLGALDERQRLDVWPEILSILAPWCAHCGGDLPCYCEDDS